MPETPQQPLITVGIGTRNRSHSMLATVNSILANTYSNFELLIVDQSTNTDTADVLVEVRADSRVRYIASRERGVSQSRNTILAQARGEIVLMTDDDCIAPINWIEQMAATFARHKDAALVFCRVEAAPHDSSQGYIPVFLCQGETVLNSISWNTRIWFLGAGMGMRRSLVQSIGGFDTALGAGSTFPSAEDADIGIRAVLQNKPVICTDATHIVHDGFRRWQQMRLHMARDSTGFGAMLAKLLRCSGWPVLILLANHTRDLISAILKHSVADRHVTRMRPLLHLYRGIYFAWRTPIEPASATFCLESTQKEALAFLLIDV